MPDFSEEFIIAYDMSELAAGGMFMQIDKKIKQLKPLAFYSHTFSDTEYNWPPYEQELFAIILAVRKVVTGIGGHPGIRTGFR